MLDDKQLPKDVIIEAIEAAMVSAYRKAVNASTAQQVNATVDMDNGNVMIYAEKEVVEEIHDERTEVHAKPQLSASIQRLNWAIW